MAQRRNLAAVAKGALATGSKVDKGPDSARAAGPLRSALIRSDPALLAALMFACPRAGLRQIGAFFVVAFVSVFVRELLRLGIVVVSGRRPAPPLAAKPSNRPFTPLRAPLTCLLFAAALRGTYHAPGPSWLASAVAFNAAWGFVSLLPALPFEGGQTLQAYIGPGRQTVMMLVSVGVAEAAAVAAFAGLCSAALGLLFLVAAISTALGWLRARRGELDSQSVEHLERARVEFEATHYNDACDSAQAAAHFAFKFEVRNAALTLLAEAALHAGQPRRASAALRAVLSSGAVDPALLAAVESANGDPGRAIATLDRARRRGGLLDQAAARLLIDLYASVGDYDGVTGVAIELSRLLGPEDVTRVVAALRVARESELAARLVSASAAALAVGRETPSRAPQPLPERKPPAPSSS
jgi:hypothetical protein